jgi:hypothetical protein
VSSRNGRPLGRRQPQASASSSCFLPAAKAIAAGPTAKWPSLSALHQRIPAALFVPFCSSKETFLTSPSITGHFRSWPDCDCSAPPFRYLIPIQMREIEVPSVPRSGPSFSFSPSPSLPINSLTFPPAVHFPLIFSSQTHTKQLHFFKKFPLFVRIPWPARLSSSSPLTAVNIS